MLCLKFMKKISKRFSEQVFKTSKFYDYSYKTRVIDALNRFNSLKATQREYCLAQFKQYLFKKIEKDELVKNFSKDFKIKNPQILFESLMEVYDFLSDAEKGFLINDLTTKNIKFIAKEMESEKTMEEMLDLLMNSLPSGRFKLPEDGIPYPEMENQINLFSRELVMENLSHEIVRDLKMALNESLSSIGSFQNSGYIRNIMTENFPVLLGSIEEEIKKCKNLVENTDKRKILIHEVYAPYIVNLKPEKLAMVCTIAMSKMITKSIFSYLRTNRDEPMGSLSNLMYVSVNELTNEIITGITSELMFEKWMNADSKIDKKSTQNDQNEKNNGENLDSAKIENEKDYISDESPKIVAEKPKINYKPTRNKSKFIESNLGGLSVNSPLRQAFNDTFPKEIKHRIALVLIYLMSETFKLVNTEKGIEKMFKIQTIVLTTKKQLSVINFSPFLIKKTVESMGNVNNETAYMDRALPSIYPPAAWRHTSIGGYYLNPSTAIRVDRESLQYQLNGLVDLSRVYSILDFVSKNPWKINTYMYNVIEQLWTHGGETPSIPKRFDDEKSGTSYKFLIDETKYFFEKLKSKKEIKEFYELNSLKADFLLKLKVAEAYKDVGKFYFPNNMDFRGRMYPIPPHLNHMGNDLCRGLLLFANSKPIGKNGLKHLKIHVANKMGKDKLPFDKRVEFVEENMTLIDSFLEDPIKNRGWLEFEDCYQALAAMRELKNAMSVSFPEDYCCSLPIQADGSCNGLQHYAALGRDYDGAFEINLIDRETPGDVYTKVAKMVQEKIKNDINDQFCPDHRIAVLLKGEIKRKIIKQTVMTTVYGVTAYGARAQIKKQLFDFYKFENEKDYAIASSYIAKLTLQSVENLFFSAQKIKSWLIDCADKIGKTGQPVSWFTPLGLPVVQPYRRDHFGVTRVQSMLNFVKVFKDSEKNSSIDAKKQQTAFPPNFIHSLDSTHLMLTSERMKEQNLDFAAVHDSYWCQVSDFEYMNNVLREEFVHMQNMKPLDNLFDSFLKRFPECKFADLPEVGNLDINSVLNSKYFFS